MEVYEGVLISCFRDEKSIIKKYEEGLRLQKKNARMFKQKRFKVTFILLLTATIILVVGLSVTLLSVPPPSLTDEKVLPPTNYPVGPPPGAALVVYDPGSQSIVKEAATQISNGLQSKGYFVYLAGINSATAQGNASRYQVVVVGGPLSNGKASNLIQSFLTNLNQGNGTRIGVFGVANSNISNPQIAPLPTNSPLVINTMFEINSSQDIASQANQFLTHLLS